MHKKSVGHKITMIGGQWKRTPIVVLDLPHLRPTPNRVRETVFNWLRFLFPGSWQEIACLDLFAGSGALGFEAASWGAGEVTLVDNHPLVVKQLKELKAKLVAEHITLILGEARHVAQDLLTQNKRYDIIFLDPPFSQHPWSVILPLCRALLSSTGYVYIESDKPLVQLLQDDATKWVSLREGRAGQVFFYLLQPQ